MANKDQKEGVEKNEAAGILKEHMQELADKTIENKKNGGDPVVISLTNRTNVRFIKDFGKHLKKGDVLEGISDQALAIYTKKGVIEKL